MQRLATFCLLALLAAGCGNDPSLKTKDITGMMPNLEFTLTSENGEIVTEKDYAGTINLLFFGYTNCPDVCPATLARLSATLRHLSREDADRVRVLFVSVDPGRDDPESLRSYTALFGEGFVGLTGTRDQLDALTRRYRTTYGYGEADAQGNYEVSHGSAVYVFDPAGNARLLIRPADSREAIAHDISRLILG